MAFQLAGIAAGATARESRAGAVRLARRLGGAGTCGAEPTDFDPLDPSVLLDPYPSYRRLHEGGPVHYCRRRGVFAISGYDEVRAAARADTALSSAESVTRYRSRLPMLLTIDRPDHTRLRGLVARDFTGAALGRFRPEIERLAEQSVAEMRAARECDAVARLASPFPVLVIARVLGIPAGDLADFRRWSDQVVRGFGVAAGSGVLRSSVGVLAATFRLHAYFLEHFEHLRKAPGDDVLSALLGSSEEGQLSEDEVLWFALLLLIAGNETTTSLLGTMLQSFAENPDQYALLREDPGLIGAAVEEALRHQAPIQGMYRTALADYDVGGVTIPRGARVLLLFGAANRDPRHYPAEPDRFRIERNPTDHLGFGHGIHFCLGAHLARLEATAVLRELVDQVEAIEPAGEPGWMENPSLRGLTSLPLRLAPA